nr:sulfatase-like hydrolase/transferase [Planctomycetota bacterium]
VAQYFPLYQRMTIRRLAAKRGWAAPNAAAEVTTVSGGALAYPKADVPFPAQPRPLNVVLIALEGARFDMLDPAVMPAVHAFGARHTTCLQHYSGGNATRFGIFSLLYGIHATYWQQVLAERRGPFLIQALERLGYAIDITSCTDLNFPEFRQTAFVDVLDRIHDTWPPGPRVDRDRLMTDRVVDLIESSNEPFFSFSFYDASHSSYLYPPEFAKFSPTQTDADVDFVTLAHAGSVDRLLPLFNRYRNSLGYVDAQIARVIAALEARGILDRTVVVITGDHGEEFGESGHFTHNSAFDRWQIRPLMVAHVPGLASGSITTPTSHIDVPATILAAIGFTAPFGDWTQGLPLGTATTRDHVLAVSWNAAALVAADGCMVFGTETYRPTIDLFDADYRPANDSDAALRRWRPLLPELARQLREFSR